MKWWYSLQDSGILNFPAFSDICEISNSNFPYFFKLEDFQFEFSAFLSFQLYFPVLFDNCGISISRILHVFDILIWFPRTFWYLWNFNFLHFLILVAFQFPALFFLTFWSFEFPAIADFISPHFEYYYFLHFLCFS